MVVPTSSIARPSKIYPNWDFWFENIPSGNPGSLRAISDFSFSLPVLAKKTLQVSFCISLSQASLSTSRLPFNLSLPSCTCTI
jgi:hypothetical protein